jgi:hypothetical protein
MKITVDHPQFEAFLADGSKTNNQSIAEFFEDIIIGILMNDYREGIYSIEEVLEKFNMSASDKNVDISRYELSDINKNIMRKHMTEDFDIENLEFKMIED